VNKLKKQRNRRTERVRETYDDAGADGNGASTVRVRNNVAVTD